MEEYKGRWKETGKFLGNLKWPEGKTPNEMQHFQWEAMKYLVSDGVLYPRRDTNDPPANLFMSMQQNRKTMEAEHELSGHHGREATLQMVLERYWWPDMYVDVKELVKTCEHCTNRVPLQYDELVNSLTVSHIW